MNVRPYVLCLSAMFCPLVFAAEPGVGDVEHLGRVFMSPEQRAELDRLRKLPPATGNTTGTILQATEDEPDRAGNASGFIVRTEGEPYLWVDGDFKRVRGGATGKEFTDQRIKITRHRETPPPAAQSPLNTELADEESQ